LRLKRKLAEERTAAEEKGISMTKTTRPETSIAPNEVKATRSTIAEQIVKADSASSLDQREGKEKSVFKVLDYYPSGRHFMILDQTRAEVRNIISRAQISTRYLESESIVRAKHLYELHQKFSLAFICIIFLFIGAPMGAIVRKGGFGYPLLVAIIFFVFFIFLTIFCKKLTGTLTIPAILGAWMPCLIMFPIGLFLTTKAMNDSSLLQTDQWLIKFRKIFQRKPKIA
ncbi:MAG: LptF/LptG family permease, partial [Saprospiraceae bacterium]